MALLAGLVPAFTFAAGSASTRAHLASSATLVISGAGDGHGVGMSQEGALGFAQHGWGYEAILTHYFTGTSLGRQSSGSQVRVLLAGNRKQASFSGADMASGHQLNPAVTYTVTLSGHGVQLHGSGGTISTQTLSVTGSGPLLLSGVAENGVVGGAYRGALDFSPALHGGLNTINVVGLEDYVRGTVACEMPSSWPTAALQAQAIASRTYAITSKAGPSGEFDLYSDTRSQLYRGVAGETSRSNAAVNSTAGQVVTYNGRPAITFFFASSGGVTESAQNAFGGSAEPWLHGVQDPFDQGPQHSWKVSMSFSSAAARLRGLVHGTFRGIEVLKRGYSPRILSAEVLGSGGSAIIGGGELAARLGLYDTWAYFSVQTAHGLTAEPDLSGPTSVGQPSTPTTGAAGGTSAG
jgi:stage II sporulation protein D